MATLALTPSDPPALPEPSLLGSLAPEQVRCRVGGVWFALDAKRKLFRLDSGRQEPVKIKLGGSVGPRHDELAMVAIVSTKRVAEIAPSGEVLREVALEKPASGAFLISSLVGGYALTGPGTDLFVYADDGRRVAQMAPGGSALAPLPGPSGAFVLTNFGGLHVLALREGRVVELASDPAYPNAWVRMQDQVLYVRRDKTADWFTASFTE